jgi:hypothetical protein
MKLQIIFTYILLSILFHGCNSDQKNIKKSSANRILSELTAENSKAIDTLSFDDFNIIESDHMQSEIISSDQLSLKLEKQIIENELISFKIIIRDNPFEMSNYSKYFSKESLLYDMDISSDYYKIKVGADTYFALIANEKQCSGTLCRFCDLLLFKEDSKTNSLYNLLPIDFFYTELHTIIPLIGVRQGRLVYYKIIQINDTDQYRIEPFQITNNAQVGINLSNPMNHFLIIHLHDNKKLEILESNW